MWDTQPGHTLSLAVQRLVYRQLNSCFGISQPEIFAGCPPSLLTDQAARDLLCAEVVSHFDVIGLTSQQAFWEQVFSEGPQALACSQLQTLTGGSCKSLYCKLDSPRHIGKLKPMIIMNLPLS